MRRLVLSIYSFAVFFLIVFGASIPAQAAPVISSLSPTSGISGSLVTITGSGFGSTQGTSTVKFGGVAAQINTWTSASILAVVPSTVSGLVNVQVTVSGIGSNAVLFIAGTNPAISNLSANSAPVDAEVTINGANFGSSQGSSTVTFSGVQAFPSSWNSTSISVPVPAGATTGNIVVTVNSVASNGVAFMVIPPSQEGGVGFVQGNYSEIGQCNTSYSTTIAVPLPIDEQVGDMVVVVTSHQEMNANATDPVAVGDTLGNQWYAVPATTSGRWQQKIYFAPNIIGGPNEITVAFGSNKGCVTNPEVVIAEYKGISTLGSPPFPFDVYATKLSSSGSTCDSGNATTTNQNDILIGANVAGKATSSAGANYTSRVITPFGNILEDRIVTATGSYDATATMSASGSCLMEMAAFEEPPNQAPVVDAGPNQTITLPTNSVTFTGSATDDGLPNNTLTLSWSKVSGPGTVTFSSPNTAVTQATFSTYGIYVLRLTANDSQLSSYSNVTVTVNPEPISLTLSLSAPLAGPDVTGTTQTVAAVLKLGTGAISTPISGASVAFTVTGANATNGNSTTDSTGTATFSYTGTHSGSDTVQASYTGQNSSSVNVNWIVPVQGVSTTTVLGRFFQSDGGDLFDTLPTATPAFSQYFPTIDFNPIPGTVPGTPGSINDRTRPITDVTTDSNGNFTGSIVAQGNGFQAGVGTLYSFNAVFTGNLIVATSGNQTINMETDDGFILGIGGGATRVSGPLLNVPASGLTPFTNLTVVGAYNTNTAPIANAIVVNFPAPGSYDYELDYNECCGGSDVVTMTMGNNNTAGIPPTGTLYLSPINPASMNTRQTQTFTVLVSDASGAVIPNIAVDLIVTGANQRQLSAPTDSTGHATFQYTGTYAGTDSIQGTAVVKGLGEYSNAVNMSWTAAVGASTFVPQGWIASPLTGAVIQGQVPVTLISSENLSSGTLTYSPTSNPSAVGTLNSNTTTSGGGTLGTFDGTVLPSGGYTIQLNATDTNNNTQISQVTVSVVGNYKPGRMTSTVTEFTVPLAGIPITISRTYDSLEKNQIEDFGYGWKLNTTVGLTVDSQLNVTFNFNGQRQTFYFQPQPSSPWFGWLLIPQYFPQPGLHGSLISNGCGSLLNVQGTWQCFGPGTYQPTLYAYTDPIGRTYTITSGGQLQSIQDLNGNTLTITQNGITSSVNGVVIPFQRDASGRIQQITDLNGKNYTYSYDGNGNLQSVQYPGLTAAETYAYFSDHSLQGETDPRGNTSTATYYPDGRLQTISDSMQPPDVWSYSYNVATNTTTTTNPDTGTVTRTDDSFGNPLSITEQVNSTTSRTTTYQYDTNKNLISMTDGCGNGTCSDTVGTNHTTQYTYDANGFQTSVQDPLGHKSTKTYNSYGGVLTATDAANTNTQTTTYYPNFNPQQVTDLLNGPGTQVSSFTYDALGDVYTYTDANGQTTQNAYDPNSNLIQVTDPLNELTHYSYDAMNRLASQTDPMGNPTKFTYDALGHLKTKTDALQNVTTYGYDNNGNKTSDTDANQHTTNYQYDNMNRLILITYPDTTTKQFTYDFRGNKLTETDQSGHVTKYVYDLAGELTSVTYAYGTSDAGTVTYTYDLDGRQATVTDELNNTTSNTYDAAGRLITVTDALSHQTNYGYDADNRKTSVQDANGNTSGFAYDARGRLATVTYPIVPPATQATTSVYTYDGMGRMLTTTDQAGKITTETYDLVGRLATVQDAILPTPNVTRYFYYPNGNLHFLQDAGLRVTSYQYDADNRRAVRTLPLNQSEYYTYDAVGNLYTHTDFNGSTTTYSYDTLNRLLSRMPDPSLNQPTVSFTYTATGRRLSMTDASGTTNYPSYDNRDRLKAKMTPEGTVNYTYDAHSNLLSIVSSNTNGASLAYSYDAMNRLAKVCDNRIAPSCGAAGVTTYSYDFVSNLSSYTYANTVQTGNVFDTQNRLTQTCEATSSPACSASQRLASYAYTLGNAGNRTNVLELSGRNVAYGYDNDYRLTSEAITNDPSGNNGTVSYTQYDAVGNRLQMTTTLNAVPSGSFSYDANDRLSTDMYDANGNTTSSAGISNTYDFENRMLAHGSLSLTYDGDGNRAAETIGGTTTKFLVDDKNPTGVSQVLDEIVSGSVNRTYAYGLQRISENQLISGTWKPTFYGYDGHGNVRFLANASGTSTDSYDFDAFGMSIRTSGTTPNPFFYSGERLDGGTGLYDLRTRYYNQATGRFWARDPYEGVACSPMTFNPYIYTLNNPVNGLDPTGRTTTTATRPGAGSEYIGVIVAVSLAAIYPLQQLGLAISRAYESESPEVICRHDPLSDVVDPFNPRLVICGYRCSLVIDPTIWWWEERLGVRGFCLSVYTY